MKTKSEVIKLMKEGTHCIYNDCPEKLETLNEILSKSTDRETGVGGMHLYYWIGRNKARCLNNNRPELDIIRLSEIELDNEKPYLFYEGEKYYFGEEYELSSRKEKWIKRTFEGFKNCDEFPLKTEHASFKYIRKIDHATKYKQKLEELKIQAENDGVNLKDLI